MSQCIVSSKWSLVKQLAAAKLAIKDLKHNVFQTTLFADKYKKLQSKRMPILKFYILFYLLGQFY